MTKTKIDRRSFIKGIVMAGAGLIAGGSLLRRRHSLAGLSWGNSAAVDRAVRDQKLGHVSDERAHAIVNDYMSSGPGRPRVVHVHDGNATGWDFGDSYYGDCVDQDSVNVMVNRGVMELTGTSTVAEAWGALIPDYVPGEPIAIKVNMNNGWSCRDSDTVIDGLIHPINGVAKGLQEIGVAAEDIWVYDAIRKIPDRFVNGCLYPDVQFFDQCHRPPGWSSDDPDAIVSFTPTYGPTPPPLRIPDMLVEATYLINMPILKAHDYAGVTLGFKNHMGTVERPEALHIHMWPGEDFFRHKYSPLVDIYRNPHIGAKTVLTLGDGLFGAWKGEGARPSPWATFDNAASNSLFFATDPVAADCVMFDLLAAETPIMDDADTYLSVAAMVGLGVFEHGDPWGSGYSQIDYARVEIPH